MNLNELETKERSNGQAVGILRGQGYKTVKDLSEANAEDIWFIPGFGSSAMVTVLIALAKKLDNVEEGQ